ncbi:hypothetical protein MLD38_035598 [Melastoma candidum]|uniref:Uncharacterized protein n=1 Tax=Melastoma candidum TaxID=119954 RepID=A0ACB9LHL9_9MYRT|nr:hypothetical protein MLD38_035598 [Melastoma candidum]
MATVAGPGSMPVDTVGSGGGRAGNVGGKIRRKTPSELRGEQLKRANVIELGDESPAPSCLGFGGTADGSENGNKMDAFKLPRYIDMRVDEVYQAKKSRFGVPVAKENAKENKQVEQAGNGKPHSVVPDISGKGKRLLSSLKASELLPQASGNVSVQAEKNNEKSIQGSRFRTVAEISSSRQNMSYLGAVDMDKALKGLATREPSSHSPDDPVERSKQSLNTNTTSLDREYFLAGCKAPLDCTLKTMMRVVTSSSVNWIYKLVTDWNPTKAKNSPLCSWKDEMTSDDCPGTKPSSKDLSSEALNSWIYPQSTLPPSLVSVLTSSVAGKVELDFWKKRQAAWEESFRSLYYLLRKKVCRIFYVSTAQFVVMFTTDEDPFRKKHTSRAYISRSTRGLRSLLREHDICFSMPLCQRKVEQVASEDLVELSEIEKHNLGQTRRPSVLSGIDHSPQSLLVISGTRDVHGLYDVLLNYRSYLTSLSGLDVPVLCSPIPFHNAAVSTPEVRCLEKRHGDRNTSSAEGPSNCLEIVDAYLPPWTISNICALLHSQGIFQASFHVESTSVGLNAALGLIGKCLDPDSETPEKVDPFGISTAVEAPPITQGYLRSLKYCGGSYKYTLTPT